MKRFSALFQLKISVFSTGEIISVIIADNTGTVVKQP